jgi:hypothetical protein
MYAWSTTARRGAGAAGTPPNPAQVDTHAGAPGGTEPIKEAGQARHSAPCSFQVPTQAPALTLLLILYAWGADNGEQEVCRLPDLRLDGQNDGSAGGFSSDELKLLEAEELKLLDPAPAGAPSNVAYIYVQRPVEQLEILPFCKGNVPTQKITLALDVAAT